MPSLASGNQGHQPGRREQGKAGSSTVRVTERTHAVLRDLSDETGEPIQDIVGRAVEAYRRQRILELTNAAYAALRSDPRLWQEELEEREAWEITIADGLQDE